MKISKYVQLIKRKASGRVIHIGDGSIVLGTGASLYKAHGLPDMHGEDQIMTVLDIEPKQREKVYIHEDYASSIGDIYGMNLEDGLEDTISAKKLQTIVFVNGKYAQAIETEDGELLFYDDALFAPLIDRMKESEYIELAVRQTPKGQRYIVFMDGFECLAAVMPMDVANEDYLKELQAFERKVYHQIIREKQRGLDRAAAEAADLGDGRTVDPETGEIYEQRTLEDMEDESA